MFKASVLKTVMTIRQPKGMSEKLVHKALEIAESQPKTKPTHTIFNSDRECKAETCPSGAKGPGEVRSFDNISGKLLGNNDHDIILRMTGSCKTESTD